MIHHIIINICLPTLLELTVCDPNRERTTGNIYTHSLIYTFQVSYNTVYKYGLTIFAITRSVIKISRLVIFFLIYGLGLKLGT